MHLVNDDHNVLTIVPLHVWIFSKWGKSRSSNVQGNVMFHMQRDRRFVLSHYIAIIMH